MVIGKNDREYGFSEYGIGVNNNASAAFRSNDTFNVIDQAKCSAIYLNIFLAR